MFPGGQTITSFTKKAALQWIVLLGLLFMIIPLSANAAPIVIKTATLVPKESSYFKALQDMAVEWEKITDGEVKIRLFPGGITGDEKDMVRKMRIDQMQAAAMSTQGLQYISQSVNALNFPMMVHSWDELDWLRSRLAPDINQDIEDHGFNLLFWADVGWVYFFSTVPIKTPSDVKNLKLFTRATDFQALELWRKGGFNPVPLTTSDVLPGLQTGLVNVVQSPAFIALSQQWFGIANHMLNVRWAAMSGGFVITKKAWNRIPQKYHDDLMASAEKSGSIMRNQVRHESENAIDIMKKHGLKVYTPGPDTLKLWQDETEGFYKLFKGVLVSPEMYNEVMQLYPKLQDYRASKSDSAAMKSN